MPAHPWIEQITIYGYKSFRDLDLLLRPAVNVLIGANGAGKSNFIGLFRMLRRMMLGELQLYVAQAGGPTSSCTTGERRLRSWF
jgi:predicted ATPase